MNAHQNNNLLRAFVYYYFVVYVFVRYILCSSMDYGIHLQQSFNSIDSFTCALYGMNCAVCLSIYVLTKKMTDYEFWIFHCAVHHKIDQVLFIQRKQYSIESSFSTQCIILMLNSRPFSPCTIRLLILLIKHQHFFFFFVSFWLWFSCYTAYTLYVEENAINFYVMSILCENRKKHTKFENMNVTNMYIVYSMSLIDIFS